MINYSIARQNTIFNEEWCAVRSGNCAFHAKFVEKPNNFV